MGRGWGGETGKGIRPVKGRLGEASYLSGQLSAVPLGASGGAAENTLLRVAGTEGVVSWGIYPPIPILLG